VADRAFTFETHRTWIRSQVLDPYAGEYQVQTSYDETNDLDQVRSLVLAGVDGYHEIITAVIVVEDVPVLMDSRAFVPSAARVYPTACSTGLRMIKWRQF
jgi:hypothetical protein